MPGRCAPDCRLSRGRASAGARPPVCRQVPSRCLSDTRRSAIPATTTSQQPPPPPPTRSRTMDLSATPRRSAMANKVAKGRKARYRRHLPSRFRSLPSLLTLFLSLFSSLLSSFVLRVHLNLCVCIYLHLSRLLVLLHLFFIFDLKREKFSLSFLSSASSFFYYVLLSKSPLRSFDYPCPFYPTVRRGMYSRFFIVRAVTFRESSVSSSRHGYSETLRVFVPEPVAFSVNFQADRFPTAALFSQSET